MIELRAALGRLRRSPGYAIGASLSLAIGMALGTAVYSIVDTIWFQPLPYGDSDRIGSFWQLRPDGQSTGSGTAIMVKQLRAEASAFSHVAATAYASVTLSGGDQLVGINAIRVSPNYFETMRMRPLLGRTFRTGDTPGANEVVISHRLWATKFGSDSTIIGRAVAMHRDGYSDELRVIGIMQPGADVGRVRAWVLLDEATIEREAAVVRGDGSWYDIVGRLAPNATLEEAATQASAIFRRIYRGDPVRGDRSATIVSIRRELLIGVMGGLGLWLAAAILILILCAVNFATMSLARGMRRRGEIAVRAALGASRWDIVRAMVTEALAIAAVSGAISVLMAKWLVSFAAQVLGSYLPVPPNIGWSVLAFGVLATMVIGFVFSAAPAVELAKVDLRTVLQGAAASASTVRSRDEAGRRLLVALQLCLALCGVSVVTAVIQADRRLFGLQTNFEYEPLVFARAWTSDTGAHLLGEPMLERIRAVPGVGGVASLWRTQAIVIWDNAGEAIDWPRNYVMQATPNLFEVLGTPLLAGRLPNEDEQMNGDGFVISESLARRLGGSANGAVGRRFRMKMSRRNRDWATVTGVVADLGGVWGINSTIYWLRRDQALGYATYVINVGGSTPVRAREVANVIGGGDSRLYVSSQAAITTIEQVRAENRGKYLFLIGVAGLALVLAIVGVYGMTSYATEVRLREFGIRIALGANTRRLLQVMFNDLWWMAPVGVGTGLFAAGRVTAYLDALYRNPMMPQPLIVLHTGPTVATALTLALIAAAGTIVPLRRVLRLDVMRVVNSD